LSQYDTIWNQIKHTGNAEVVVSISFARTLEDGVKRVKTAENTARRLAGLVGWSKLTIQREQLSATRVKIKFALLYLTAL